MPFSVGADAPKIDSESRLHWAVRCLETAGSAFVAKFRADPLTFLVDMAIAVAVFVLLVLAGRSMFSHSVNLDALAQDWKFNRPGAVLIAQQLAEQSKRSPFPFPYEQAYRTLERPDMSVPENAEGSLLFLFWYASQREALAEDRRVAGHLFLSRISLHPHFSETAPAVLAAIKRDWTRETVQALIAPLQGLMMSLRDAATAAADNERRQLLESLCTPAGDWGFLNLYNSDSPTLSSESASANEEMSASPPAASATTERFE